MIEISGVAHVVLAVNRFEVCVPFYESILSFMGMKCVQKGKASLYYIGGNTAVAIGPTDSQYRNEKFIQTRIGLHHLCFRSRSREDIDKMYEHLKSIAARIVHPPEEGPWCPGYYSVLFEDPDGIRLELSYVPGKGLLAEGVKFDPSTHYE